MRFLAGTVAVARRARACIRVSGADAGEYLQRMVSNDVLALAPGESCEALLLTPKARVIAPLRVLRRAEDGFLLLTEPELGEIVRAHLSRLRFAARCEIELETHVAHVLLGEGVTAPSDAVAIECDEYGVPAVEVLDAALPDLPQLGDDELERLRIEAGTPRFGREIDDRVLPAEAGLDERAISFTKGCYPGQEPIARLRYRGHVNRSLRRLRIDASEPPPYDAPIEHEGKPVGRVTSAVPDAGSVVALGYVRGEVPLEAVVTVGGATATMSRPRP
jgi:folate-binding protein YgfZ